MIRKSLAAVLGLATIGAAAVMASDWPQYRGSAHDGVSTESINTAWSAAGPKVLWKVPTPTGFSSFTIAEGKAFTQVSDNGREGCIALDAATGKQLWSADVGVAKYQGGGSAGTKENKGGDGPRSTPVVSDGVVYVYSTDLVLHAFSAKTGKLGWTKNMVEQFGGKNIGWGNAASPVIDGNLLYVAGGGPGESFVAFNKKTGAVVWKTGTEKITHSTPVIATLHGTKQVIFFVQSGLVSVATGTGKELWRFPFKYHVSTAISPVVCGDDIVYCSAGYDVGGGACKVTKSADGSFSAKELWATEGNSDVANHWSTPVYKDGYLYGMFSFKRFGVGPVKCVEAATGKITWTQPGFGAGNVILADGKLIALADDGQLVVIDPSPESYKEVTRFQAVTGKCWSTPALSDGHLYVRSTKEGACLDVAK